MRALVLLSGGMDSVAALHWALWRECYNEVRALFVGYGQPAHDAEFLAAHRETDDANVRLTVLDIGEAVRGILPIAGPVQGCDGGGVSRANLPARNAILLSIAAAEAARLWPGGDAALVIGCTRDDGARFPDCQGAALDAATKALRESLRGIMRIHVTAPWRSYTKALILLWCELQPPSVLRSVLRSSSCYLGTACGTCDACVERRNALIARSYCLETGTP